MGTNYFLCDDSTVGCSVILLYQEKDLSYFQAKMGPERLVSDVIHASRELIRGRISSVLCVNKL